MVLRHIISQSLEDGKEKGFSARVCGICCILTAWTLSALGIAVRVRRHASCSVAAVSMRIRSEGGTGIGALLDRRSEILKSPNASRWFCTQCLRRRAHNREVARSEAALRLAGQDEAKRAYGAGRRARMRSPSCDEAPDRILARLWQRRGWQRRGLSRL